MKNKQIIPIIGVLTLFVLVGIFYAFYSSNSENSIGIEKTPPAKTTVNQNSNEAKTFDSKSKLNNETNSIRPSVNNAKESDKVVDQMLHSSAIIDENVLGAEKEKLEIEITVYDGDQNRVLTDYPVEFEYTYFDYTYRESRFPEVKDSYVKGKGVTDNKGNLLIISEDNILSNLHLITQDYAIKTFETIAIDYGKNKLKAKLFRGGVLEFRAFNNESKVINDLQIIYHPVWKKFKPFSLNFDTERQLYIMKNIPLGSLELSFKAVGYHETVVYKLNVVAQAINTFDIKLNKPRKLTIDFDLSSKPNFIKYFLRNDFNAEATIGKVSYKNINNLYELEIDNFEINFFNLEVEGFITKVIYISPEIDYYKISLEKPFDGFLRIINEKEESIKGAEIYYSEERSSRKFDNGGYSDFPENQIVFTDEKGAASIKNLKNKMKIYLNVSAQNYKNETLVWDFSAKEKNAKTVILKSIVAKEVNISGRILCENKVVQNASIILYKKNVQIEPVGYKDSDEKGNFKFSLEINENSEDTEYFISAFHIIYGIAKSPTFKISNLPDEHILTLVKEKSFKLKLVDSQGMPLADKSITIEPDNMGYYLTRRITTDKNGEFDFYNYTLGKYTFKINDFHYRITNRVFNYVKPEETIVLVAEKRLLKKLNIFTSNKEQYNGILKVEGEIKIEDKAVNEKEVKGEFEQISTFSDESSNTFIYLPQSLFAKKFILTFNAPGFAIIRMGPYIKEDQLPIEFELNLQIGTALKINVEEFGYGLPIENAKVELLSDISKIAVLPTNKKGEVQFKNLQGKYQIKIVVKDFVIYKEEIEIPNIDDVKIKLIKGGSLNFSWEQRKEDEKITIVFWNEKEKYVRSFAGEFELKNILPGEYVLGLVKERESEIMVHKIYPGKISIVNEKVFKVNIDELFKK